MSTDATNGGHCVTLDPVENLRVSLEQMVSIDCIEQKEPRKEQAPDLAYILPLKAPLEPFASKVTLTLYELYM